MAKHTTVLNLELKDKIKHILEEARVILPGTQAIWGFQLVAIFSPGFQKLPQLLKNIHMVSIFSITASIIFLLSIASFHRIATKGKDTDSLNIYGSSMLEIALFILIFGIACDIYVILLVINWTSIISVIIAGVVSLFALIMWFIFPIIFRLVKIYD